MKILIVGVSSLLSQAIINKLNKANITGIYNVNYPQNDRIKLVHQSDLSKLKNDFDIVFYIASYINYSNLNIVDKDLITTNIILLNTCIEKFNKARFIYTSSISVHGVQDLITERTGFAPMTNYAISKLTGETIVQKADNYSVLRFPSLYGVGMKSNTFLPKIVDSAIVNKKITLYGNGERKQNYISYHQASDFFIKAMNLLDNNIYLCTYHTSFSNTQIAEEIKKNISQTSIIYESTDTEKSTICDNSYTLEKLNINFETCFEQEIKDLIEWKKTQF